MHNNMTDAVKELRRLAFNKKNHNYALPMFIKKFEDTTIVDAIKYKLACMKRLPDYENKYKHLTIYNEEIIFLIEVIERTRNNG